MYVYIELHAQLHMYVQLYMYHISRALVFVSVSARMKGMTVHSVFISHRTSAELVTDTRVRPIVL